MQSGVRVPSAMSSRANVINHLAGEAGIIFCLLRTPHDDTLIPSLEMDEKCRNFFQFSLL